MNVDDARRLIEDAPCAQCLRPKWSGTHLRKSLRDDPCDYALDVDALARVIAARTAVDPSAGPSSAKAGNAPGASGPTEN